MELLKERIRQTGVILSDQVIKLDTLITHQVDPQLMAACGREFAKRFSGDSVTKVLTIESSGISPAFATALELGVPLVFARRKKTLNTDKDAYCERVPSFTKGMVTDIIVSREFLGPGDRVLLIDDMIANGDAARGLIKIIARSGAELVGLGVLIEKAFQTGARTIREQGIRVESLVTITSLDGGEIAFA
jgi:xanthine phosphoribosyltransferase